jgi:hypothetical protein
MSQQAVLTSPPATMSGDAARIPAAAKALPAILTATIHITRASTGKVDTYEIVGTPDAPPPAKE